MQSKSEYPLVIDKLPREPYDKGQRIFLKNSLTIYPGITAIVGCNGSGKTTLLNEIRDRLRNDESTFLISYYDVEEGRQISFEELMYSGDVGTIADLYNSSEGEKIYINFGRKAIQDLGYYDKIKDHEDEEKNSNRKFLKERIRKSRRVVLLIDGLDSGLSIDILRGIQKSLREIYNLHDRSHPNIPLYIVYTANNFELVCDTRCVDSKTMKLVEFHTYTEFAGYVMHSRNLKDRREKTYQNYEEARKASKKSKK